MDFKVGDKVRIIEIPSIIKDEDTIKKYLNKVTYITETSLYNCSRINIDCSKWVWGNIRLEKVEVLMLLKIGDKVKIIDTSGIFSHSRDIYLNKITYIVDYDGDFYILNIDNRTKLWCGWRVRKMED